MSVIPARGLEEVSLCLHSLPAMTVKTEITVTLVELKNTLQDGHLNCNREEKLLSSTYKDKWEFV